MKYLIAGLGNPGKEYENTRHNIGFKILDALSEASNIIFSDEEIVLLKYICEGLTNKQIADVLHLSSRTIEAHRAKLLDKTGTNNSVALAVYAISKKLIEYNK